MMTRSMVAALLLCVPGLAAAQPVAGPYISLGGGAGFQQNQTVDAPLGNVFDPFQTFPHSALANPPDLNTPYKHSYTFDTGVAAQASVGYGLGHGLRLEIEGDFFSNRVSSVKGAYYPAVVGGTEQKFGGMVNALYDFDFGLPVFPYVGIGAGGQIVALRNVNPTYVGQFPLPNPQGDLTHLNGYSQTSGFAYQGIAGVAVPLAFLPGLSLTAEYRFMGLVDPLASMPYAASESFYALCKPPTFCAGYDSVRTGGERRIGNDLSHSLLLGIRYAFGAPPLPPAPPLVATAAPPPAPAQARIYLVFFDWDRAELSARARDIVAEAAQASTRVQTTRIHVNGYTDLSGTPAYNERLSVRRAMAVRAELVRDGVPDSEIGIHGYGESHPLVPTAPGVREPQNRRVEIILS